MNNLPLEWMESVSERYNILHIIEEFTRYYNFLAKLYLSRGDILVPPSGGWPHVDTATMQSLDKSNEVVFLLRHLPYLRSTVDVAPQSRFIDWQAACGSMMMGEQTGSALRLATEPIEHIQDIPRNVIGLTSGDDSEQQYLLDIGNGLIYWPLCWDQISRESIYKPINQNHIRWTPQQGQQWRRESPAWTISSFFDMLKEQFIIQQFVPLSRWAVTDSFMAYVANESDMIATVQAVYREHGWPVLAKYKKQACLAAVRIVLAETTYPAIGHGQATGITEIMSGPTSRLE